MTDFRAVLMRLHDNLNLLQERQAKYGDNPPVELLNQIEDHWEAIGLTEQALSDEVAEAEWNEALKRLLVDIDSHSDEAETSLASKFSVKFFAVSESTPFANTPGRYSDRFEFTIINQGKTAALFKLKFTFPKLEKLIEESCFPRFRKVLNHTDFTIQENEDAYQVAFKSREALLRGESLELERAFIIYSMNLPDKELWLKSVQNAQLNISWQLFSNDTVPLEGEQSIGELYKWHNLTISPPNSPP